MPEFKCRGCGGLHSIDSKEAEGSCLELMDKLEFEERLDYQCPDAVPAFSTAPLFGEARGQMFGLLVCAPARPGESKIILKAFSGQYNGIWEIPGWVPPILSGEIFSRAVAIADPPIKKLNAEIIGLPDGDNRNSLIRERRKLSQKHMRKIHEMYTIRNFRSGQADLFTLFGKENGIPAGTGDCCGPKLLNYAALKGLRPLSLAEFFWGRENRSGSKQHGCFYPPCIDKCRPILGYMLCGADDD